MKKISKGLSKVKELELRALRAENKMLLAEAERNKLADEMKYLRTTIGTILSRPIIATLSNDQLQMLTSNLVMYFESSKKDPAQMD